jgi:hypothetical protein
MRFWISKFCYKIHLKKIMNKNMFVVCFCFFKWTCSHKNNWKCRLGFIFSRNQSDSGLKKYLNGTLIRYYPLGTSVVSYWDEYDNLNDKTAHVVSLQLLVYFNIFFCFLKLTTHAENSTLQSTY